MGLGGGASNFFRGYSKSNYHLIHTADIHQSYLIYLQVFNMLKILNNNNRLIHFIFHFRMLHLVLPYNNQN